MFHLCFWQVFCLPDVIFSLTSPSSFNPALKESGNENMTTITRDLGATSSNKTLEPSLFNPSVGEMENENTTTITRDFYTTSSNRNFNIEDKHQEFKKNYYKTIILQKKNKSSTSSSIFKNKAPDIKYNYLKTNTRVTLKDIEKEYDQMEKLIKDYEFGKKTEFIKTYILILRIFGGIISNGLLAFFGFCLHILLSNCCLHKFEDKDKRLQKVEFGKQMIQKFIFKRKTFYGNEKYPIHGKAKQPSSAPQPFQKILGIRK